MTTKPKSRKNAKIRIASIHSKTSNLRHFRLIHHQHTGKLVAHHHTSFVGLTIILLIVGLVLYTSKGVWALPPSVSHGVNINAIVPGPPPTEGALITSPQNGAVYTDQTMIDIAGSCAPDTTVVVSSNNSVVGSANCVDGAFTVTIQLDVGQNVLSAKNYDFINQAGPDTPTVTIILKSSTPSPSPSPTVPELVTPPIPAETTKDNPYGLDQQNGNPPCDAQNPTVVSAGGKPKVSIVCLPRLFKANVTYSVGFWTYGGAPPYAVDIDWGDGETPHTLISLVSQQYKVVTVKYAKAGAYTIKINMRDSNGLPAYVQAGATVIGGTNPIVAVTDIFSHIQWFETPIPLYLLAVALTLGFWMGDLFDHYFGKTKQARKTRKHA